MSLLKSEVIDNFPIDLDQALHILKKYWQYSKFRPLQDEIINAVLDNKDVLALMPTGGGKSICFQVPGMVMEGICIVISPLIALMKDQVEQLQKRNIKAAAIYSGMSKKEIDVTLDNCIYGNYKFLYVSPERLKTDFFQERVKKMPVNLLAVDEAHCISQWGYDFRPAYLDIIEVKALLQNKVATIALTATATTEVKEDIVAKLKLNEPAIFIKSFARSNLSYVVRKTDNKDQQAKKILNNVPGSSVIYLNTRKATHEWAVRLNTWGINANYYNGGMTAVERNVRQQAWMLNKSRVMVATNAFGMGIDKPDVRTVIHLALPTSVEAYYQEAGRAGRDEKKAYATVLYDDLDAEQLIERIEASYPSLEVMKRVYQCLANYYKLAIGSGENQAFPFDIKAFSSEYNLETLTVFHSLKRLEKQEIILMNEAFYQPSKLMFIINKHDLYQFQVANAKLDLLIKAILRTYGGEAYVNYVRISEKQIGDILNKDINEVIQQLNYLHQQGVIIYEKQKDQPEIIFLMPRQDVNHLPVDIKALELRRSVELKKAEALLTYLKNDNRCRTLQLLDYFGEVEDKNCGVCDVCVRRRGSLPETDLIKKIKYQLKDPLTIEQLVESIKTKDEEQLISVVRELVDQDILRYDDQFRLYLA